MDNFILFFQLVNITKLSYLIKNIVSSQKKDLNGTLGKIRTAFRMNVFKCLTKIFNRPKEEQ